MSISPVSDLIVDVARAADPQKASAASRALETGAAPETFSATLRQAAPAVDSGSYAYRNPAPTLTPAMTPERKAAVGLEGVLLKGMIEEMLPKDAPDVYGSGTAGDVWRSMMSEKIAEEVAKSGALHIADRLFATHQDLLQPSTVNKIQPAPPLVDTRMKI
jgi:peptidoglycan hydrolase FlgJ